MKTLSCPVCHKKVALAKENDKWAKQIGYSLTFRCGGEPFNHCIIIGLDTNYDIVAFTVRTNDFEMLGTKNTNHFAVSLMGKYKPLYIVMDNFIDIDLVNNFGELEKMANKIDKLGAFI